VNASAESSPDETLVPSEFLTVKTDSYFRGRIMVRVESNLNLQTCYDNNETRSRRKPPGRGFGFDAACDECSWTPKHLKGTENE
jgi:hypothetical protein